VCKRHFTPITKAYGLDMTANPRSNIIWDPYGTCVITDFHAFACEVPYLWSYAEGTLVQLHP